MPQSRNQSSPLPPPPPSAGVPDIAAAATAKRGGSNPQPPRGEMNTDITASVKPEYPVVDRNPPFTKVVGNFSALDYLRLSTISAVSVTVGYLSGIKPGIRGPSMVTGGLIGVMGGFMYAYQNSAGRLMGFFPNDSEVARYKYKL